MESIADLAALVSFDSVAPAVLGVAGVLISLFVVIRGVRMILEFVRGGEWNHAGTPLGDFIEDVDRAELTGTFDAAGREMESPDDWMDDPASLWDEEPRP